MWTHFVLGSNTGIVATCGGRTICLIDCNSGRMMKRYQHRKGVNQKWTGSWICHKNILYLFHHV